MIVIRIAIFLLLQTVFSALQVKGNYDSSKVCKKNIIKTFVLFVKPVLDIISIGHEIMLGKNISGEFVYNLSLYGGDNSIFNSSYRLGVKYNFKSENSPFFNNTYSGLFAEYVKTQKSIDQATFNYIDSKVLRSGIFLGKMLYLTKWLLIELGLNTSVGRETSSRYDYNYIVVNKEPYRRTIFLYGDKKEWKFYFGARSLIGVRF